MAISCCSSGLAATALVALLLLPAQYYVPELHLGVEELPQTQGEELGMLERVLVYFPPLDVMFTLPLLLAGLCTYVYGLVHRKLTEKRIANLNRYLVASMERLRTWDAQQEQLEATIAMVQNATSEYNLLLYLLLHQRRCLATANPSNCFFDKSMDDELSLRDAVTDTLHAV